VKVALDVFLALHLLSSSLAFGLPVLIAWFDRSRPDAAKALTPVALVNMSVAVVLGVAVLVRLVGAPEARLGAWLGAGSLVLGVGGILGWTLSVWGFGVKDAARLFTNLSYYGVIALGGPLLLAGYLAWCANRSRIERAAGEVYVTVGEDRTRAAVGQAIPPEASVSTVGESSAAVLRYPDSTRLHLRGDALLRGTFLSHGVLTAEVAPRPAARPMVLSTQGADIVVRGTRFTVFGESEADCAAVTRSGRPAESKPETLVEVERGKVEVVSRADHRRVELAEGNYAGADLAPLSTRRTLLGHTGPAWYAAVHPGGRLLASNGMDRSIKLWNLASGDEPVTLAKRAEDWFLGMALSPDGKILAAGTGHLERAVPGEAVLWDVASRRVRATLRGHTNSVFAVAFSPDGRTLATGAGQVGGPGPGEVKLWDVESGEERATLPGSFGVVFGAAFSAQGDLLATAGADRRVRLWDLRAGRLLAPLEGHESVAWFVALSPDGRRLASCGEDGTVRIWDPASGRAVATLRGHEGNVWTVAWSPDGRWIASGGEDRKVSSSAVASIRPTTALRGRRSSGGSTSPRAACGTRTATSRARSRPGWISGMNTPTCCS
jgi:hypothetical protein